jgi:hypothetical protein
MPGLPTRQEQIIAVHASFIRQVVELALRAPVESDLQGLLKSAEQNGWGALVGAIRRILGGQRDISAIPGLDEEDQVIAEAILRGLQSPDTLPEPGSRPEPALAAPGLAGMIHAAATGNVEALQIVSNMAEQMSHAGGPLARLASVVRPLINGERDPRKLCRGMDRATRQLVLNILEELGRLGAH